MRGILFVGRIYLSLTSSGSQVKMISIKISYTLVHSFQLHSWPITGISTKSTTYILYTTLYIDEGRPLDLVKSPFFSILKSQIDLQNVRIWVHGKIFRTKFGHPSFMRCVIFFITIYEIGCKHCGVHSHLLSQSHYKLCKK